MLPLFDSGLLDGVGEPVLYYAMPYVDGQSLREHCGREPRPRSPSPSRSPAKWPRHWTTLTSGIVHRDIKPENVLLAGEHAFVADFGIALALDAAGGERLTRTGLSLGTPAYMSPEQATPAGSTGERSLQPGLHGVRDDGGPAALCRRDGAGGLGAARGRIGPAAPHAAEAIPAAIERVVMRSLAKPRPTASHRPCLCRSAGRGSHATSTPLDTAYRPPFQSSTRSAGTG